MTCIRILEVIPVVLESHPKNSGIMLETSDNMKWLHDLADWGKSSLAVVFRYWKQTLSYLLGQIKKSWSDKSFSAISDIEKIISCGEFFSLMFCFSSFTVPVKNQFARIMLDLCLSAEKVSIDEVSKQVARLSVSLKEERSALNKTASWSKFPPLEESLLVNKAKGSILDSKPLVDLEGGNVIVLSDDEKESDVSTHVGVSNSWSIRSTYYDDQTGTSAAGGESKADLKEKDVNRPRSLVVSPDAGSQLGSYSTDLVKKMNSDNRGGVQASQSLVPAEPSQSRGEEVEIRDDVTNCFLTRNNTSLMKVSDGAVNSKEEDSSASLLSSSNKKNDLSMASASKIQQSVNKAPKASDAAIKEIVCDADDDAWQFSFFKPPRRLQPLTTKPITSGPKRQVIQLSLPLGTRPGSTRLSGGIKRFQPPRLDDWYRPILELDFFVAVGLASETEKDSQSVGKLKEIPVCFQSPDGYFEIFRPLVLEEFKAQLQSSYQEMSSSDELCCGSLSVLSVERIDDFHVVRFVQDENESPGSRSLMENDLILLTRQPLQNSISDIHTVGKVFHT